jgi:hypothetical protein
MAHRADEVRDHLDDRDDRAQDQRRIRHPEQTPYPAFAPIHRATARMSVVSGSTAHRSSDSPQQALLQNRLDHTQELCSERAK